MYIVHGLTKSVQYAVCRVCMKKVCTACTQGDQELPNLTLFTLHQPRSSTASRSFQTPHWALQSSISMKFTPQKILKLFFSWGFQTCHTLAMEYFSETHQKYLLWYHKSSSFFDRFFSTHFLNLESKPSKTFTVVLFTYRLHFMSSLANFGGGPRSWVILRLEGVFVAAEKYFLNMCLNVWFLEEVCDC